MRRGASIIGILPGVALAAVLLVRFRPTAVARFNRAFTNRFVRRFAGRTPGFALIIHRGRNSGRIYRTPVNVFTVPEGFLIALPYGRDSEWVRNVLVAGGCAIEIAGTVYQLSSPVIVFDPTHRRVPPLVRVILRLAGVTDYLQLSKPQASLR